MKKVKSASPTLTTALVAFSLAMLALLQNRYGQYTDVRQFYIMHFSDGQNLWPYSYHTLLNSNEEMHPVEYPALTGLIMWLISFAIPISAVAPFHYYWLTGLLNAILLGFSAHLLERMSSKKVTYYFIGSLAVLYSLNRNWDIWAVTPMVIAVLLFDRRSYAKSAIFLAISIATKFFPVVLLLPISIYFIRKSKLKELFVYLINVAGFWTIINLPFMLVNFEGWAYFYKFSFERGLGSASIYEIIGRIGVPLEFNQFHFYLLNLSIFLVAILVFFRIQVLEKISPFAFFALFAFTFFNKQYSMQYIIWLSPFALLALHSLPKKHQKRGFGLYLCWQVFEFLFQFAFFQNILTNLGEQRNMDLATIEITSTQYTVIAAVRYLLVLTFFVNLVKVNLAKSSPAIVEKEVIGQRLKFGKK